MKEDPITRQALSLVSSSFELKGGNAGMSEEDLVEILAQKIAEMLERQPEQLMSLLYRLDVLEEKIHPVMRPDAPEPANIGLARLVLERQKQRIATKQSVKPAPLEDMEGWEW